MNNRLVTFLNDRFELTPGNLGALFILGYALGSGRWKKLIASGKGFVSSVGNVAVIHALDTLKKDLGLKQKSSDPSTTDQSSQNESVFPQSGIRSAWSAS